ncbi:hypothetical protein [Peptacetobacter hiranonis]|uniref:tetratricopeptide repeat protein n=1 Tax=Peptacetobacter hiranonis TaxID=89152 RepID=UPI002E76C8B1|nr:hypothetical protein [Peptacetobacter hiranonis]MEE0248409.1 hypothetical protein [Peptacetobacter hiranonis]
MSKVIHKIIEAKYKFVRSVDFEESDINDEVLFIDDTYVEISYKNFIKRYNSIQKELENIVENNEMDSISKERIGKLLKEQDELIVKKIFIISNNEKYLEFAIKILGTIKENINYKIGLEAVKKYKEGYFNEAEILFQKYYSYLNKLPNHYLINKTYSKLLIKSNDNNIAMELIRKAIEVKPDDLELHKMINEIYKVMNMLKEAEIEEKIIKVLGGK